MAKAAAWVLAGLAMACSINGCGRSVEPTRRPVQASRPVEGTVVLWHDEEGWGAVQPEGVAGEAWVHFSNIRGTGYKQLTVGDRVRILYETPGQDGYPHRAVWVERLDRHH